MREKIALVVSLAMIATGLWFWWGQIQEVLELLSMAYG